MKKNFFLINQIKSKLINHNNYRQIEYKFKKNNMQDFQNQKKLMKRKKIYKDNMYKIY